MKAVVLVGGQGTRLRPITYDIPKALVPLRNRPFMGYMLDFLRRGGLDGAVLSLGYLPDPIQAYLEGWDGLREFSVDYAVERRTLGTAGGIKNADEYLDGETFVVVNGDVLTGTDLVEAIKIHKASDALATITLTSVEDPTAYGLVEVDHEMVVKRFLEKPAADEVTTNLVNAGVYVLEPEVLGMIPAGREVSIEREIFPSSRRAAACGPTSRAPTGATSAPRAATWPPPTTCSRARSARTARASSTSTWIPPSGRQERQAPPAALGGRGLRARQPRDHRRPVLPRPGLPRRAGRGRRGEHHARRGASRGRRRGARLDHRQGRPVGEGAIVRGLSVLGRGCVVGEGNVLDQGIRVNPGVILPPRSLRF
jgi:mannose-1-phosphate guanylyltransferase